MTTIVGVARGNAAFSILVDTLIFIDTELGTEYVATLNDPAGPKLTVFAPTNAAFGTTATDLGFTGDPADTAAVQTFLTGLGAELLETIVTYHVVPGALLAADVAAASTLTTLQGNEISADDLPTLVDREPDLIDPSLVQTDIPADNGVVHVIDRVLIPVDLPGNDAPSITDIAVASGPGFDANGADFDLLREAVIAADLAATLADPDGDFTVFAPNDAAFVALAQNLGFEGSDEAAAFGYIVDALRLLSKGGDPIPLLESVLLYHVAGESLQASQVIAEGSVTTLQGGTITLDGLTLQDADPDLPDPTLIATDIQAENGVVHVIDNVLIPADLLVSDGANDVDFLIDTDGPSRIDTGADADFIDARDGRDRIDAGEGDDVVLAGAGRDRAFGGAGDDTLLGEDGRDRLFGGTENDLLDGGADRDRLFGGAGDDTLTGGADRDRLTGGEGSDTFVFSADGSRDVVRDFELGVDLIDLTAFGISGADELASLIEGNAKRARIEIDDTVIVLRGVDKDALGTDDFLL